MNNPPAGDEKAHGRPNSVLAGGWRWLRTLALLALGSWLITHLLDYSARTAAETKKPAGMVLGMLHGACMPATWPMLVLGKDTVIYAPNNDGRPYKLGYTLGVNLCGAVFFGLWFWRWQRWRQGRKPASCQAAKAS